MENNNFQAAIRVNIGAAEVFKKISELPAWWGVKIQGRTENLHDVFEVKMGGDSFFNFTVTESVPGKKLVWLVTDCNMPWYSDKKEWQHTKLVFEISENASGTTIHFTHEGLKPGMECYTDCKLGWTHWICTSLYSWLTTGKGQFKQRTTTIYSVSIEVPNSPAEIFYHLLHHVAAFWPEELSGKTSELNDEFTFTTGATHFSKNKITELVPDKKVVWFTTESIRKTDNFDWTGTKMIFELTPKGKNTIIKYTFDGIVLENEMERLKQICDAVITDKLFHYLTAGCKC